MPKRFRSGGRMGGWKKRKTTAFRRPVVRKRRAFAKAATKMMKAVTLKMSEPKRNDVPYAFSSTGVMVHDTLYEVLLNTTDQASTLPPTRLIVGGGPSSRIGDEVYSTGFMVRGTFGIPFDRRNTIIKIWLLEYNTNQGSPTNQAQWYRDTTGNNMLDPINNDRFPGVKLLRTLRVKARDLYIERGDVTDSGSLAQIYYNIWIPFKRKLRYTGTAQTPPISGCKERLSLIATAYDTASTITTDNLIEDHKQVITWYYKDP